MKKDYNLFVQDVAKELEKILGASYTVRCQEIEKNNRVTYQAVMISDNVHNASPCYNLENYYELYEKPEDIKAIAQDILKIYRQGAALDFPLGLVHDRDEMLNRVLFRVVSTDRNAGQLADVPHHDLPELGLSMLFYLFLESTGSSCATMLICNRHLWMWGTSEPELLEHAWKNTPVVMGHAINSMYEILNANLPDVTDDPKMLPPMYIITNKHNLYGAACILYPDVLDKIAQKLGSDFYILPSSLHETIAVPAEGLDINQAKGLKAMVSAINQSELKPEEVLSDNVYYYCCEKHKLSMAV